MVILEIVFVFNRRNPCIFNYAIVYIIYIRTCVLCIRIYCDAVYLYPGNAVWRSSFWMAVIGMYNCIPWGNTIVMSWHYRALYFQNIS